MRIVTIDISTAIGKVNQTPRLEGKLVAVDIQGVHDLGGGNYWVSKGYVGWQDAILVRYLPWFNSIVMNSATLVLPEAIPLNNEPLFLQTDLDDTFAKATFYLK